MKRLRPRRPSPALLVACAALFVALGGTVMAATKIDGHTIRAGSTPGNRLEAGSVPGNRLKSATISRAKLKPGTLTGKQIDASTLGKVPSSTHADSADIARRASTATAADHATDATTINGHAVGCIASRRQYAGACWDLAPSAGTATAYEAAAACGALGGELPRALALLAFVQQPGLALSTQGEWTSELTNFGSANHFAVVYVAPGTTYIASATEQRHYRCVTPFVS